MSGFIPFAGSSGANQNLNNTYERLGQGAVGAGTQITAGSGSKGSYSASLGTTSNAWSGFWVLFPTASTSNTRYLVDISIDNGSTVYAPNIYIEPNSSNGAGICVVFIPLNVASGSVVKARAQGSGAGNVFIWLLGIVTNSQSPPMFTTMAALTADTTNTRAGSSDIAMVASGSTTFSEGVSSTATQYGALLAIIGTSSVGQVSTGQAALLNLATGAAASETIITGWPVEAILAATSFRASTPSLIYKTIPASTRLSGQVLAATVGANDKFTLGLYGFS